MMAEQSIDTLQHALDARNMANDNLIAKAHNLKLAQMEFNEACAQQEEAIIHYTEVFG